MGIIDKKTLIASILLLVGYHIQAQNDNLPNQIFGKWITLKSLSRDYTKYNIEDIKKVEKSILCIERNRIYFDGVNFIDTCYFNSKRITYSKLFDKKNEEYHWFEDGTKLLMRKKDTGPLPSIYTKEQLSKFIFINLGCGHDQSIIYLNADTLILNYIGGVTFFLVKIADEKRFIKGVGSTTKKIQLKGNETSLSIEFDFYNEPDKLIIENQFGVKLFQTEMVANKSKKKSQILLNGESEIVVYIQSIKPSSKWSVIFDIQ